PISIGPKPEGEGNGPRTRSVSHEPNRPSWAAAHGRLDLGAPCLARVLDEHARLVVVAEVEDLGRHLRAHPVALTQHRIDDHAHRTSLVTRARTGRSRSRARCSCAGACSG